MLTLTDNCATIVKSLSEEQTTAGLRISQDGAANAQLSLSAAEAPQAEDQVVEQDGATVFLDPNAAQALDQMVLDAGVDGNGNLTFAVARQE